MGYEQSSQNNDQSPEEHDSKPRGQAKAVEEGNVRGDVAGVEQVHVESRAREEVLWYCWKHRDETSDPVDACQERERG